MAIVNFAKAYLVAPYTSASLTFVVQSNHGGKFGATPFNATVWNSTDYADPADDPYVEIVTVNSISGDIMSVTRAQESTVATAKNLDGKTYAIARTITALTYGANTNFDDILTRGGDVLTARGNVLTRS